MQATRMIKTIEDTRLRELTAYVGQQVEIIIWPVAEELSTFGDDELKNRETQFFRMLDQYAGSVAPWTREELYER